MNASADAIAAVVLAQFAKLPSKRKPAVRDNGLREWVPLSGIVLEKDGHLTCIALATGMKCLPASRLPDCNGIGIHDWHAEILALRAFNRFLLDECHQILEDGKTPYILQRDNAGSSRPFKIRADVRLHMYCSEAPCGDASMELIMAAQEDMTPWTDNGRHPQITEEQRSLPGRAFFSQLGVVRRKPGRGDAPASMSKSCSDKLAAKQGLSLLSSITALFVDPSRAYIDRLVLPEDRYSATGCSRAFGPEGRLQPVANAVWEDGNLAAAWTLSGIEETVLGGVIQGRKAFDVRGASAMARRTMWAKARELGEALGDGYRVDVPVYCEIKMLPSLATRRAVKEDLRTKALTQWICNQGDDGFELKQAG
ncbi:hypothetical protein NLU13_0429 [Sarocladium strictum]|uniref:A to I editase domain-containing protein n=1 Tax=Sarocladium strictum TaxID=5046 RepID=A0AA39GPT2_SARSR|nr:hypothetical protein NLU13_0429 [Sarocladium strictum]